MKFIVYVAFLLQLTGLLLFCRGFFPHKKAVLHGFAEKHIDDIPAIFDRLIFIVIDAWRSDFAFGESSHMSKLNELIVRGSARAFTAKAATPTVTLPRLKCLTTGAITGFLDAIMNIAESDSSSTVASQDSWIGQMKQAGRELHMFGDDTWLRLFPESFRLSDGTSSFFVSDFTEVDKNVTRHLDYELRDPSWDTLILHYLGLDHIGHLEGPDSRHMPGKQMEMDSVLSTLFHGSGMTDEADDRKTLIVALGDHGMTGDGNHGGASDPEVYTAVVMLSELFAATQRGKEDHVAGNDNPYVFHDEILQSDVVPALSMLMGLPIPQNSLGIIPRSFISVWPDPKDQLHGLVQNAKQLQKLLRSGTFEDIMVDTSFPCPRSPDSSLCALHEIQLDSILSWQSENVTEELYMLMRQIQEHLLSSSNDYGMPDIYTGLALLFLALILNSYATLPLLETVAAAQVTLVPILHAVSAFASSFIEEEQVIWYFFAAFGLMYLASTRLRRPKIDTSHAVSWTTSLLSFRLTRRYNQTGQKFSGASDVGTLLQIVPYVDEIMIVLVVGGLLVAFLRLGPFNYASRACICGAILGLSWCKVSTLSNVLAARLVWLSLSAAITCHIITHKPASKIVVMITSIVYALQTRPRNYPLLFLFYAIYRGLRQSKNIPASIALFLALQQASYFALGNSNALSGLDLSQAYNGVSTYNEMLVGILLFVSTFIGPIFWQVLLLAWLSDHPRRVEATSFARTFLAFGSCLYAFALCISCFILRHHLFVFSVFSPKLLFVLAWSVFHGFALISVA